MGWHGMLAITNHFISLTDTTVSASVILLQHRTSKPLVECKCTRHTSYAVLLPPALTSYPKTGRGTLPQQPG